jgi:hypothetical protein
MVIYNCEPCSFTSVSKSKITRHLNTNKHIKKLDNKIVCESCNNIYTCRQNLARHKKKCKKYKEEEDKFKNALVLNELSEMALKTNDEEFENKLKEMLKNALEEILPPLVTKTKSKNKLTNANSNNNSTMTNSSSNTMTNSTSNSNNTINNTTNVENLNIQVFLNEHCKDAMTIQHFAKNLAFELEDILSKKEKMFGTITNIVVENLKPLSVRQRPIHCTDYKQSKWMVNDAHDGWTEDDGNQIIKKAKSHIHSIFNKLWDDKYTSAWKNNDNLKDRWVKIIYELTKQFPEKEILKALKKIHPESKLSYNEIKIIIQNQIQHKPSDNSIKDKVEDDEDEDENDDDDVEDDD